MGTYGCLIKLVLLPLWLALRAALLTARLAIGTSVWLLRRTTPVRLAGYAFAIAIAIICPAALFGALACKYLRRWVVDRRLLSRWWSVAGYVGALVCLLVAFWLWRRTQIPPYYWVVTCWGGQLLLALFGGLLLQLIHNPSAWHYLSLLVSPPRFLATSGASLLVGPAAYASFTWFFRLPEIARQLQWQGRREGRWARAVQPGLQTWKMRLALKRSRGHPHGLVRWGWDQVNDRPYDLEPASLSRHLLLLGVTGSGKTTAIARLAEGLIRQNWAIFVLDCKGGGLRQTARKLADVSHVPYRLVDPAFPDRTLRYNPCTGTPADVKNKLIGALSFGSDGEVYKQVSELAIGLMVEVLQALDRPVTLESLRSGLSPEAMRGLAGELARADRQLLAQYVKDATSSGRLATEALETLRARLGNFQRSHFAPILEEPTEETEFDLDLALRGGVTYVSLPATAASEDVPLMGRILLQDLKQAVARREHALGGWARRLPRSMSLAVSEARVGNALLVIDEFAALRDPEQLQDLLLQARSAGVALALSSQMMPQDAGLAIGVKGVGLHAALRLSDVDAQQIADLIGTYHALELTHQTETEGGAEAGTGRGSVREVERYIAHPNDIKSLPDASAVVKLDQTVGRGRTVTVVRFWPAEADWPAITPTTPPAAPAGEAMPRSAPDHARSQPNLPWLPEPPNPRATSAPLRNPTRQ